jgi:hypothetical protein
MLELSDTQIDAIRSSELRAKLADYLEDPRLVTHPLPELAQDDIDCLWDACVDVLTNEAPVIEGFTAEQDTGPYHVGIRGVPGAYFVFGLERDNIGVFSDLEEARSELDSQYGEFIVK